MGHAKDDNQVIGVIGPVVSVPGVLLAGPEAIAGLIEYGAGEQLSHAGFLHGILAAVHGNINPNLNEMTVKAVDRVPLQEPGMRRGVIEQTDKTVDGGKDFILFLSSDAPDIEGDGTLLGVVEGVIQQVDELEDQNLLLRLQGELVGQLVLHVGHQLLPVLEGDGSGERGASIIGDAVALAGSLSSSGGDSSCRTCPNGQGAQQQAKSQQKCQEFC